MALPVILIAADGAGLCACTACITLPFKMNESAKAKASKALCSRARIAEVKQNRERMSIVLLVTF
jgi:hypothetical protein